MQARLERLRRWSELLDSAFSMPVTGWRFGWDPIVGLIPGIGDLLTPLFSILIIRTAMDLGVPRVVQARMLLNALVDAVAGAIPIVGDLLDASWKANVWNMRLLEQHAWAIRPPSRTDWLVVGAAGLLLGLAVALPILFLILFLHAIGRSLL
jgi:hypothetical protein